MNIIVKTYNRGIVCRPDTSWERENKDVYTPDFVCGYGYAPILFARISKAGKCVGAKFAGRYFESINYGLLLYPDLGDGCLSDIMDNTSVLPFPLYDKVTLESGTNVYCVSLGGKEIYSTCRGSALTLEEVIVEASRYVSLRIGDIVGTELDPCKPLVCAGSLPVYMEATFCGNPLFDFNIR